MNTLTVFFLCIQVSLVQKVFSQCSGNYGPELVNNAGLGFGSGLGSIAPGALASGVGRVGGLGYGPGRGPPGLISNAGNFGYEAPYGGTGEGNVAVAGELPVAGNTAVIGQVPILGAVSFIGSLPAAGSISISGRCSCGCDGY